MLDAKELGPGFPEWTELGQETGLDPLGMQRPIELIYQSLLPGVSTITLRLRYYSFFSWLLQAYVKEGRATKEDKAFRRFQRRAEALYALICARGNSELGVAGIEWATRRLSEFDKQLVPQDFLIDFRADADPDTDQNFRYLRNLGGAFGGIYASQMREMGLVKLDDIKVLVPFCMPPALPLAAGFEESLGDQVKTFMASVEAGRVSLENLDQLAAFKPSNILVGSAEQRALASVLMGRHDAAMDADLTRRQTLVMLLQLAKIFQRQPKSEEVKWIWFGADGDQNLQLPDSDLRPLWALYQASDLLRLAYEVLLFAGLRIVKEAPTGRLPLSVVVSRILELADLPSAVSLDVWMHKQVSEENIENLARSATQRMFDAASTGESADEVKASLTLITTLVYKAQQFDAAVTERLGTLGHFQSLASEAIFFGDRMHLPVMGVFAELVRERILKRHLWVASRKFRNQKAYTFLIEPDEGALRFRSFFRVSPSSPRITQAVQFLHDVKFLDDRGITELGLKEIGEE